MTQFKKIRSTVNSQEISKFSQIADSWWEKDGDFKLLHKINPLRLQYIVQHIAQYYKSEQKIEILDIGCGGGLLSIPLAQQGFSVTGLDAGAQNIAAANAQKAKQLVSNVSFIEGAVEDCAVTMSGKFDVLCNLEIVEHVDNAELFLQSSWEMLKNEGLMFISTINRTMKSLLLAKIGAEYILRWLPVGTHSWEKFMKPSEILSYIPQPNKVLSIDGIKFNPINNSWCICDDVAVNYIMVIQKK